MRILLAGILMAVGCVFGSNLNQAAAADKGPFQVLGTAQVSSEHGTVATDVNYRGYRGGYYGRGYYGRGYGGYYRPYYGGYRGYYGNPYYSGYRGYYGSGYRGYYRPGFGVGIGIY